MSIAFLLAFAAGAAPAPLNAADERATRAMHQFASCIVEETPRGAREAQLRAERERDDRIREERARAADAALGEREHEGRRREHAAGKGPESGWRRWF